MKLRTKIFVPVNAQGEELDLNDVDVALSLNGERQETRLKDVFSELELEEGEIYGNSLLSYYTVAEDGSLQVQGSRIELIDTLTGDRIRIKEIYRPTINDDTDIPFEHVQKFAEFFKIERPDEVFHNLNAEEKQAFIDQRLAAETAQSTQTSQEAAKAAQEAENALKASIDKNYVQDAKAYRATRSYYEGVDFKEYTDGPVSLFYGDTQGEPPCVLIKRGKDWWEEIQEPELVDKTDTSATIQYYDGEQLKSIELDLQAGSMKITDVDE